MASLSMCVFNPGTQALGMLEKWPGAQRPREDGAGQQAVQGQGA